MKLNEWATKHKQVMTPRLWYSIQRFMADNMIPDVKLDEVDIKHFGDTHMIGKKQVDEFERLRTELRS